MELDVEAEVAKRTSGGHRRLTLLHGTTVKASCAEGIPLKSCCLHIKRHLRTIIGNQGIPILLRPQLLGKRKVPK